MNICMCIYKYIYTYNQPTSMTRPILKLAKRLWNGAINEIGILSATTGQKEWRRGRVASSTKGGNHGSFPLKSMSGITFPL